MGSLRDALQKATKQAFTAIGDIPESVTYRSMTGNQPQYDPSGGDVTEAYDEYTVEFVFARIKTHELQQGDIDQSTNMKRTSVVQANNMWALIPQDDLTPTPKITDVIVRGGVEWAVADIQTDPAAALWKLRIRKG